MVQGNITGLGVALREFLRNYQINEDFQGISGCVLAMPVEDWASWAWVASGATPSIAAGNSDTITMFTVPDDERAYLDDVYARIDSGDNTINQLIVVQPAGYGGGNRTLMLLDLTTPATTIYWPSGQQTIEYGAGPTPKLLEPGALLNVRPSGAGAAASVIEFNFSLRRTKIVRTLQPYS